MTEKISDEIINYLKQIIEDFDEELFRIQNNIWKNPETKYEEVYAHKTLTDYMEKQPGWTVTRHAFGLATAFVCEFHNRPEDNKTVISFNSEYDALPGIGHACGHNLIAVSGLTGALAASIAMKKFDIPGTIKYFGTPAEEGGGGKVQMLRAGAYKSVDVSLMAHPGNSSPTSMLKTTAIQGFRLDFYGRETHAAASPWDGINALDAMVITYNALSVLRQQILPTDIVQCCINEGGMAPNIITAHTSATFGVRSRTRSRLAVLLEKVLNCIRAGAIATGCKFKIAYETKYYNMIPNEPLSGCYRTYMNEVFGHHIPPIEEDSKNSYIGASSDQGNVSWEVPAIQPQFQVKSSHGPHNPNFTNSVQSRDAHASAIETGLCLAFTGIEVLQSRELLIKAKNAFEKDLNDNQPEISEISEIMSISDLEIK